MAHSSDRPLIERARGRWQGILSTLGVPAALLNPRKHQSCPFCGGKDRFRYTNHADDGRFICNGCGNGTGVDLLMKFKGWDFATAAKEVEAILGDVPLQRTAPKADNDADARAAMQKLWKSAAPITSGDFVDRYLASRCVSQSEYPLFLRKVERLRHEDADNQVSWHPAMVAKVTAPDGKPVNVHRTYLTSDGAKAAVDPVRKLMRGGIAKGSSVRLFDSGPVMGVAEGIETALAASELFRIPVWAAINSTLMTSWEPPEGTSQVLIFGDNDPKFGGQAAANALAHRIACKDISVRVEIPEKQGQDWNDVLIAKRGVAA
ncbi:MAG TPA: toprim domain-containing protein [Tianweitania sediminis]|jgi:putative DNA primase/helicase|nr:toprim domain-containing protein [Tianweitania sediminis]